MKGININLYLEKKGWRCDSKVSMWLYKSLVLSLLGYGHILIDKVSKQLISSLDKIQELVYVHAY